MGAGSDSGLCLQYFGSNFYEKKAIIFSFSFLKGLQHLGWNFVLGDFSMQKNFSTPSARSILIRWGELAEISLIDFNFFMINI